MTFLTTTRWFGTSCALSGGLLVAANVPFSGWGFVLFLGSSVGWACAAIVTRDWAQLAMQAGFTAINTIGIWRWLLS